MLSLPITGWSPCLPALGVPHCSAFPGRLVVGDEGRDHSGRLVLVCPSLAAHRSCLPEPLLSPLGRSPRTPVPRGNAPLGSTQLRASTMGWLRERAQRGIYLPLSVSACGEMQDLVKAGASVRRARVYGGPGGGGHRQSLRKRSFLASPTQRSFRNKTFVTRLLRPLPAQPREQPGKAPGGVCLCLRRAANPREPPPGPA